MALVLGENDDPQHPGIGQVRQWKVDQPVLPGEGNGGLGPVAGQGLQPGAAPTGQDDGHHVAMHPNTSDKLVDLAEAEYVVICAGSFDLLVELVCEDDDHLLQTIDSSIRSIPGVRSAEAFVYLKLAKETYQWGTR